MSKDFSEKYFQPLVKKFVSSVLLVDDQLSYIKKETKVTTLANPLQGQVSGSIAESPSDIENVSDEIFVPNIIKNFSKENYLLTAINPKDYSECNKEEFNNLFLKLAEKADVIILDWEMNLNFVGGISLSGESFTKEALNYLNKDNRYRLVYIYTKEPDTALVESNIPNPSNIEVKIYRKTTSPEDLAKKVKLDFLSKTNGIMTAELLQSLYMIRKSTFDMFNSLNKDYDEALMYHKILLTDSNKIADFKRDIVSDEIFSYLNQHGQQDFFLPEVLKSYLEENNKSIQVILSKNAECTDLKNTELHNILNMGYTSVFSSQVQEKISKGINIENYLPQTRNNSMKEFSIYTTMINKNHEPNLKLGCIVKNGETYMLCIQPPCDSERIPKPNPEGDCDTSSFIFLHLKQNESCFDFYIKHDEIYYGLKVIYKKIEVLNFYGDDKGLVSLNNGNYYTADGKSLTFICCLKPMFAQKIANNFAANISRVGIDQFEWLRLKSREN